MMETSRAQVTPVIVVNGSASFKSFLILLLLSWLSYDWYAYLVADMSLAMRTLVVLGCVLVVAAAYTYAEALVCQLWNTICQLLEGIVCLRSTMRQIRESQLARNVIQRIEIATIAMFPKSLPHAPPPIDPPPQKIGITITESVLPPLAKVQVVRAPPPPTGIRPFDPLR